MCLYGNLPFSHRPLPTRIPRDFYLIFRRQSYPEIYIYTFNARESRKRGNRTKKKTGSEEEREREIKNENYEKVEKKSRCNYFCPFQLVNGF